MAFRPVKKVLQGGLEYPIRRRVRGICRLFRKQIVLPKKIPALRDLRPEFSKNAGKLRRGQEAQGRSVLHFRLRRSCRRLRAEICGAGPGGERSSLTHTGRRRFICHSRMKRTIPLCIQAVEKSTACMLLRVLVLYAFCLLKGYVRSGLFAPARFDGKRRGSNTLAEPSLPGRKSARRRPLGIV